MIRPLPFFPPPSVLIAALAVLVALSSGCASRVPLPVVPSVDLERCQGLWYEIARLPHWLEKNCVGATAQFTLNDDGTAQVIGHYFKGSLEGPRKEVRGAAWSVDPQTNAKFKVRFIWPFTDEYWVIGLAPDYSYVVIGEPSREDLWILARSPFMDEALYRSILANLETKGYDASALEHPPQKRQPDLEQAARPDRDATPEPIHK